MKNKTLQAILNSLAEGVVVTDKDGKFLFVNPVAEKILGMGAKTVKPEEWASSYGTYHLDKITPYSPDKLPLARAIKGEEIKHEVIFIRHQERPEGIFIDITASPLKDDKGEIKGGTIIFRDITERIQAQVEQKEYENRLNDFFYELPIPSYIWQQVKNDFFFIKHNKAAEALTESNIKEFLGVKFDKKYEGSPYLQDIKLNFARCIKEEKSISHEMKYQLQSTNEIKNFIVTYVYIPPDFIMVNTEDITKRKLEEKELRKLSNAVEQTADSVFITDTEGIIEYVNPAFETTTGYKCEEVIGQTPRIFKSGKHNSKFYENLWDTIKKGKTFHARIINKKKNNEPFWADQTITSMKDNDGNITNYVSVLRDITESVEKQKQELQLKLSQEQNKKVEEIDQMKSNFFANISHEFRTPLTLILGPADKLLVESPSDNTKKQAGLIRQNAIRLLGLINQLLDLSKLEAGKLKLEASLSNIVSFVKGVTQAFESFAEQKDIKLKVVSERENIEIYFDKEKMLKILSNLLSNSLKFTLKDGFIEISVKESRKLPNAGFIEIKVRDNGIGIPEEELPKLFERFYQIDPSQVRGIGGTGIGLALTKELVELHRGFVNVSSKLGEGSEFTIELPPGKDHLNEDEIVKEVDEESVLSEKIQEQMKMIEADSALFSKNIHIEDYLTDSFEEIPDENKIIILIVEDNADVRDFIKDSLGNEFVVEEAANGEQGIRKAEKIIPDLIISDIRMPKMDGNELTRILKNDEKTSHIPIILLTGKSGQESKLEGLETGADDYLTKPFDTKELQIRVRNLINSRRKLQEKYGNRDFVVSQRDEENLSRSGEAKAGKLSNLEEKFMNKVLEVIENHLSEEEFSIEQFGKEVGMSRVQLHRKLKALSGKSASNYLRSVRLSKAKQMIKEQKGNVSEIAYSVGFSSPQYFTRCFKEEFGYPPSDLIS